MRPSASTPGFGALALALFAAATLARPTVSGAQGTALPRIEVESQRSVSVVGSSESLRAVIEELCETSGVELKSYRAPDRPVSAHYEHVPLRHVFERLLREESFMLGFAAGPDGGEPHVAWVTVIGTEDGKGGAAPGGPAAAAASPASGVLPVTAMGNPNAASRIASAKAFARRLDAEEELRSKLLKASIGDLTKSVSGQKHARAYIQTLRTAVQNPQVRAKLNALLARVR